jgi:lysozyme family protein
MTNFDSAFNVLIEIEGGLSNNPQDSGGLTRYGISQAAYPNLDISNLTLDAAKEIYLQDYWQKCSCELLPLRLATYYFTFAVNCGTETAIKTLQQHLGIAIDGILGQQTKNAMASSNSANDYQFMTICAFKYINMIDFNIFGHGWLNRLFKVAIQPSNIFLSILNI